jgi:hypothetical protein
MLEKSAGDTSFSPGDRYKAQRRFNYFAQNDDRRDYASLAPLPDIPTAVLLTYPLPKVASQDTLWLHFQAVSEAMNHTRIANYTALIENNHNSYVMLLPGYQHFVQRQDPALVVTVIEGIYQKALER